MFPINFSTLLQSQENKDALETGSSFFLNQVLFTSGRQHGERDSCRICKCFLLYYIMQSGKVINFWMYRYPLLSLNLYLKKKGRQNTSFLALKWESSLNQEDKCCQTMKTHSISMHVPKTLQNEYRLPLFIIYYYFSP